MGDETFIGDAQVAPETKKGKRRRGRVGPYLLRWGKGICPNELILARVIVTGAMVVGVNPISNRMSPAGCPLR